MKEKIDIVFENQKIRVEKIYSFGITSEKDFWYNNPCDEWVSISKGRAILITQKEKITLSEGDSYYVAARQKHRVDFTSQDCEWLCVYIKV